MTVSYWAPVALSLVTLPFFSTARKCGQPWSNVWGNNGTYPVLVNNQTELDSQTQGCDLNESGLLISENYTGSFSLNGHTNVSSLDLATLWYRSGVPAPKLTTIEINDALFIGRIDLWRAGSNNSLSAPQAEIIRTLKYDGNGSQSLDFPSLKNASVIALSPDFSSANFPLLREIYNKFELTTDNSLLHPLPPIALDLPSLQFSGWLRIEGNLSRLFLPMLERVKEDADGRDNQISYREDPTMRIINSGPPIAIAFPLLQEAQDIGIGGNFTSVSIPALRNTSKLRIGHIYQFGRTIESSSRFHVDLSALRSIQDLTIKGNITAIRLDSLESFRRISIQSVEELNCSQAIGVYERQSGQKYDPFSPASVYYKTNFECINSKDQARFDAARKKTNRKKPTPSSETIVGIVMGVVVALLLVALVWWSCRRVEKKRALMTENHQLAERNNDHESVKDLPPYHATGDAPPDYSPSKPNR
ncbi:hypothetical protein BJ875DRAFT_546586 [Amylocarpus encephaloides]|uniref:Peptidase A1 domain-containing protein n=1 Tax=Amylocarpus encephaloides TaxID=45428 RepID=A0A9P8C289_9HELO|nr:hypothetical protein BJ875DRAFT_546586 [Amylocarpus encephaloides]